MSGPTHSTTSFPRATTLTNVLSNSFGVLVTETLVFPSPLVLPALPIILSTLLRYPKHPHHLPSNVSTLTSISSPQIVSMPTVPVPHAVMHPSTTVSQQPSLLSLLGTASVCYVPCQLFVFLSNLLSRDPSAGMPPRWSIYPFRPPSDCARPLLRRSRASPSPCVLVSYSHSLLQFFALQIIQTVSMACVSILLLLPAYILTLLTASAPSLTTTKTQSTSLPCLQNQTNRWTTTYPTSQFRCPSTKRVFKQFCPSSHLHCRLLPLAHSLPAYPPSSPSSVPCKPTPDKAAPVPSLSMTTVFAYVPYSLSPSPNCSLPSSAPP